MKELDGEVQRRLAAAGAVMRAAAEAAVTDCAAAIAEQARADCPVETGRLRDSIGVEVLVNEADDMIEARVYAAAPYAAAVELGSGKHAPRPFLLPAWERVGPTLVRALHNLMRM